MGKRISQPVTRMLIGDLAAQKGAKARANVGKTPTAITRHSPAPMKACATPTFGNADLKRQ